jgi:branched-chain amino acid aminotransferase
VIKRMGLKVFLNGQFVPQEEAKISVFDHGLLYGDGVFEGIRSYNGRVFKLKEHIDRLFDSSKAIMLQPPLSKEEIMEKVLETLRINNLKDAYIRLVITRGKGDLGLDPQKCQEPTIFIITDKIVLYPKALYEKGLEVVTVPTRRNIPEAISPRIKSLNYLNNILAKIEANNAGVIEAIMLNSEGYVTEGTGENIFIVKDDTLLTPPPHTGILVGITRNVVMELASNLGIPVEEKILTRYDLYTADECFFTGTAAEVIPVVKIDLRTIGDGKPGMYTKKIMKMFHELTQNTGVSIYK